MIYNLVVFCYVYNPQIYIHVLVFHGEIKLSYALGKTADYEDKIISKQTALLADFNSLPGIFFNN